MSVLLLVPNNFNYCKLVVSFEIEKYELALILKIVVATQGPLNFYLNFRITLLCPKKGNWNFYSDYIDSVDHFWNIVILMILNIPNHKCGMYSCWLTYSWISLTNSFSCFQCIQLIRLGKLIPWHVIFFCHWKWNLFLNFTFRFLLQEI
jgi:hypothetical protein